MLAAVFFTGCQKDTTLSDEAGRLYNYAALEEKTDERFEERAVDHLLLSFAGREEMDLMALTHVNGRVTFAQDGDSQRKYVDLEVVGTPELGGSVWPKLNIYSGSGGQKTVDWSAFSKLKIDVKNNTARQIDFHIHFWDAADKTYRTYSIALSANSGWTTFACELDFAASTAPGAEYAGFDGKKVAGLSMFFYNPTSDNPIFISLDNLRLEV
jgi:hypothetical protein